MLKEEYDMDWKKATGFAFLFYVIINLIALIFVIFDKSDSMFAQIFLLLAIITTLVYLTYLLKPRSIQLKIYFGFLVFIISLLLDMGLTVPFSGWGYFHAWWSWFIYVVIFLTPLCVPSAHLAIQTKPNNSLKKK